MAPRVAKHRRILGQNIREFRKAAALSQEKLAELAEVHPNYIGDIERGEENVSVDVLVRIGAALDLAVCELTKGF